MDAIIYLILLSLLKEPTAEINKFLRKTSFNDIYVFLQEPSVANIS